MAGNGRFFASRKFWMIAVVALAAMGYAGSRFLNKPEIPNEAGATPQDIPILGSSNRPQAPKVAAKLPDWRQKLSPTEHAFLIRGIRKASGEKADGAELASLSSEELVKRYEEVTGSRAPNTIYRNLHSPFRPARRTGDEIAEP